MTPTSEAPPASPRLPRTGALPMISVVVASSAASDDLSACLNALAPRCEPVAAQVIVVRACADSEMEQLRAAMPGVRFLSAPPSSTHRELQRIGMMEAAGDIVAFTSDRYVVDDAWAAVLLRTVNDSTGAARTTLRPA